MCGVTLQNEVWCWGNRQGLNKIEQGLQVEIGNNRRCVLDVGAITCNRPVLNTDPASMLLFDDMNGNDWQWIDGDRAGVCGLNTNGEAWCMAEHRYGVSGALESSASERTPRLGGNLNEANKIQFASPAHRIAVADQHACLVSQGEPYCWGARPTPRWATASQV